MAAIAMVTEEAARVAEREDGIGFRDSDREVLITLKVQVQNIQEDIRDGHARIMKLEQDRVGRSDISDILAVIEDANRENHGLLTRLEKLDVRMAEVERWRPELEMVKKYLWIGIGGLGVLQVVLTFFVKH